MPANANFVAWKYDFIDGMASLGKVQGIEDIHQLNFGYSRAQGFPDDAYVGFDPEHPRNNIPTDSLFNTDSVVFASQKLVDVLVAQNVQAVEYLPIEVRDHKGKRLKVNYFILNPVGLVECLNAVASGGRPSRLRPGTMGSIKQLVLDESKVPEDRALFRVKEYPHEVIVRKSLADAIDAAGIVGPRWASGDIDA